jgi:hypothetical protein
MSRFTIDSAAIRPPLGDVTVAVCEMLEAPRSKVVVTIGMGLAPFMPLISIWLVSAAPSGWMTYFPAMTIPLTGGSERSRILGSSPNKPQPASNAPAASAAIAASDRRPLRGPIIGVLSRWIRVGRGGPQLHRPALWVVTISKRSEQSVGRNCGHN